MKKIVCISLGPANRDYEAEVDLLGERFRVRRIGTGGDSEQARRLVAAYDGQADAIALGGMAIEFRVGDRVFVHRGTLRIAHAARTTPVVGGRGLRRVLERRAVAWLRVFHPEILEGRSILFLSGIASWDLADAVRQHTDHVSFADPVLHFGVPKVIHTADGLREYARVAMPLLTRRPYARFFPGGRTGAEIQARLLGRPTDQADVIAGDLGLLLHYIPGRLDGKTLLTDTLDVDRVATLRERGVERVVAVVPDLLEGIRTDAHLLQAMFLAHLAGRPRDVTDADYERLLDALGAEPQILDLQRPPRHRGKFAALVVAADSTSAWSHPRLRPWRWIPADARSALERIGAVLPPIPYARVVGVRGADDSAAEGWVLTFPTHAAALAGRGKAFLARRLRDAARRAEGTGARILAVSTFDRDFSEVVAAAASTEALPITSGVSMALSADLWAAREACIRVGMATGPDGRVRGRAVVLAGTASGMARACTRLLSIGFQEVAIALDPSADRGLLLADLAEERPERDLEFVVDGALATQTADLVVAGLPGGVTAASVRGLLPAGAVLLDLDRPPTLSVDAARTDVAEVIAGELSLPGGGHVTRSLGLPPGSAYASIVEAAVLALEDRFECFSPGGEIDGARVKEIYRLARRHGVRLAAVRGPGGVIEEAVWDAVKQARRAGGAGALGDGPARPERAR